MKTKIDWQRELKWRVSVREVEAIQRDAWQSATKAQTEKDDAESAKVFSFTPVPFPEKEVK